MKHVFANDGLDEGTPILLMTSWMHNNFMKFMLSILEHVIIIYNHFNRELVENMFIDLEHDEIAYQLANLLQPFWIHLGLNT